MNKPTYQRIRLVKVKDDIYECPTIFVSARNGGQYKVIVNMKEMTYKIRNVRRQTLVKSSAKNGRKPTKVLRTLMRRAKKDLISLGVEFRFDERDQ